MKKLLNMLLVIILVTLILYSFFYLKFVFYIFLGIFAFILLVLGFSFLLILKNYLKVNYIDMKTFKKVKKLSNKNSYNSFVYVHLQEKVEDNKEYLIRIILKKYLDNKEVETKIIENEADYVEKIWEFKENLPLVFMSNYDFALLINSNNNYNMLGNDNCIIFNMVRKNKKYLEIYQQAYINNGLVNSACDEMIKLYLQFNDEKSEKR